MGADGADEANVALCSLQTVELGNAAIMFNGYCLGQLFQHFRIRKVSIFAEFIVVLNGHQLNKAHIYGILHGQVCQSLDLIVIESADEYSVDLDLVKARFQRSLQTGLKLLQLADAGNVSIFLRIQCVKTQIHPVDTCLAEFLGKIRQQDAVGSQTYLLNTLHCRNPAADGQDVLFHQGFAAGETNFADAKGCCHFHSGDHLILIHHLMMGALAHTLFGHTIAAA